MFYSNHKSTKISALIKGVFLMLDDNKVEQPVRSNSTLLLDSLVCSIFNEIITGDSEFFQSNNF